MEVNNNKQDVINQVLMQIKANEVIDEEKIRKYVDFFSILNPLSEDEKNQVAIDLHSKLMVKMDRGACIKEENHKSWYYSAKPELEMKFWDRYRIYLHKEEHFNSKVVDSLDKSTDEMMDMIGNPRENFNFQRRGLVIGDVQSGKTSTYIALINKAADAGYRVVILLTGTIEKLRKQTQSRIDKGFVGLDSSALIRERNSVYIGVGNINQSVTGFVLTSTNSDFNKSTATKLNCKLSSIQDPVLFVIKKNKSVLEKLEQWLRIYNAIDGKIKSPLLMIDDEADNASINTSKEDENPTTINAAIRKLLSLFDKASYVGFTATPFANIFIDPDSNEDMINADLFPKDFIYALEPPTNYIGARSVFEYDGKNSYMLKSNEDCENYLPLNHKIGFVPNNIPESLKEAIASFFISNSIRDLRGQKKKHRSMLVNISRFIAVQKEIEKEIDVFVRELQREIKNYYLTGKDALNYKGFILLKKTFDKYYSNIEFDWNMVQKSLHTAVAPIVVRSVHGGNAAKNLNYDECEDEGLRIIAIGGYSLSRGLTLEGLCISYFYRNSKMYDTLMQMGRWFGYRDGYEDLCQIWMNEENIDWYGYISVASDELRREVYRMQDAKKTPNEFGLSVRSDINSLLVTARNKMRSAKDYDLLVSLNGRIVETKFLHSEPNKIIENYDYVKNWFAKIENVGFQYADVQKENLAIKNHQILNVPKKYITELLYEFKSHYLNTSFRTDDLIQIINNFDDDTVDNWDVTIAEGEGDEVIFCGKNIKSVLRSFKIRNESKALQMSGARSRLGSTTQAKAGLTKEDVKYIETKHREFNLDHATSEETYFKSGIKRNPLLVVYPVQLKCFVTDTDKKDIYDLEKQEASKRLKSPLIGLSIGIPSIDGRKSKMHTYKINIVKYKELFDVTDGYEEEWEN